MTVGPSPTTIHLDDLPVAAALVDGEGRIVATSEWFAELVGRDRYELAGGALLELVAPDDRGRLAAAWTTSTATEVAVAGRRNDGLPFVATFAVPGGDPSTVRLLVATARGAPMQGVTGSERRASDGRDLVDSAISHDLRGALRGVAGFLAVLDREGAGVSDESQGFLDTARRSAATADVMAERLVEYIRLGQRPFVTGRVDLSTVFESVVTDRAALDGPPLDVSVDALPDVVGNRSLLAGLVSELLTNAAKFGASTVAVTGHTDGPWFYLRVDDDGPGIDAELRQRAFDLFRMLQPKGRYPGVGAGLALVRRVADIHGGASWIEAGEGGGTAVVIRLLLA